MLMKGKGLSKTEENEVLGYVDDNKGLRGIG